jgi:hypothetical protein
MYTRDAINHFGNKSKTAAALGVTKQAASKWGELLPERLAYRAERVSRGKLRVDPSLYQGRRPAA